MHIRRVLLRYLTPSNRFDLNLIEEDDAGATYGYPYQCIILRNPQVLIEGFVLYAFTTYYNGCSFEPDKYLGFIFFPTYPYGTEEDIKIFFENVWQGNKETYTISGSLPKNPEGVCMHKNLDIVLHQDAGAPVDLEI